MYASQELQVQFMDQEDPLEEGMATHSIILVWRTPQTGEPHWLQNTGLQRVGYHWATEQARAEKKKEKYKQRNETFAWIISLLSRKKKIVTNFVFYLIEIS